MSYRITSVSLGAKKWRFDSSVDAAKRQDGFVVHDVSLYFREGKSDKVYRLVVTKRGNGSYDLECRYGRRFASERREVKVAGASLSSAEGRLEKIINEKLAKGYKVADEIEYMMWWAK